MNLKELSPATLRRLADLKEELDALSPNCRRRLMGEAQKARWAKLRKRL